MSRLTVEVDDFAYAARTMHHTIGESVRITLEGLTGTLQANTDLVGEDSAGSSWSGAYDPAARSVLEATAQIVDAAFRTSQLFAQSGVNYAAAEHRSTTGGSKPIHAELTQLVATQPATRAPRLPGSAGAGDGTPAGWWLVEHTVGYLWPGGHQDRLRATANGWRQAAGGIENVAFEPVLINARFTRDRLPEADDIGTVCAGFNTRLNDLARTYRSLGRACDEYADQLDECHEAVRSELTELLAESAGIQVAGAVATIVTFGLAQAPTQAVQAARVAAVAGRIGRLIEKVVAVARRLAASVRSIAATAQEMTQTLQVLKGAKLAVAGVTHLPGAARAGRALKTGRDVGRSSRMSREARVQIGAAERLAGSTPKLLWTSWANYPKVVRDGRTYARIGDRLYSRHAVDRMQPRALGVPAGAVGAGRNLPPTLVEGIIRTRASTVTVGPLGESRLVFDAGDIRVIVEDGIVVTVLRVRPK